MAGQSWAPQSPDLTGYAPQSPDLSAYKLHASRTGFEHEWKPQSPNISQFQPYSQQPQLHPSELDLNNSWNGQHHPSYSQIPPQQNFKQEPQYGFDTSHQFYPTQDPMPQTRPQRVIKPEEDDAEYHPEPTPGKQGRGKKRADNQTVPLKKMDTGGVEVKTKFPTARIKRIMQADEDVGKVAQVTPVVVAKALELFMIRLITASAGVAKGRNSKRVLPTHMKSAVMQDEQFDNLREIVDKVPDAPVKGGGGGDDDDDTGDAGPKKRKKSAATGATRGRKKKSSDDDM